MFVHVKLPPTLMEKHGMFCKQCTVSVAGYVSVALFSWALADCLFLCSAFSWVNLFVFWRCSAFWSVSFFCAQHFLWLNVWLFVHLSLGLLPLSSLGFMPLSLVLSLPSPPLTLSVFGPQLAAVLEEKSSLQVETQSLREKLSLSDPQDASTTITGKKLLLLQSQMEQLQEENYRSESYPQHRLPN